MIRRPKLIVLLPAMAILIAAVPTGQLTAQPPAPVYAPSEGPAAGAAPLFLPQPMPVSTYVGPRYAAQYTPQPAAAQQPIGIASQPVNAPPQPAFGYRNDGRQAALVGERYAVPVAYRASPSDGAVEYAVARAESPSEVQPASLAPIEAPASSENTPPPGQLAPAPMIAIPASTTFGLEELTGIATSQNPILRREQARIEKAKGTRVQAGLYENPIMFTNNPEIWAGQNTFVNMGFKQKVIVKGKQRIERAAADQGVRFQTAESRIERAKLLTEVRKQYYKTLAAKHRIYLTQHLAAIAERGVEGARQLEKAGEGPLTDVLLLDTEYQRALINQRNAETNFEGELKQLAAVVGSPGMVIEDIQGSLFAAPPEFNEQDVHSFALELSSYAERARADLTKKQAELRRAEVDPYPDLELGPHWVAGTIADSSQYWFTVEFQIPVWNLNQGNIRKGSAEVHKSIAANHTVRNELSKRVAELFAEYRAARNRAERIRIEILPNAQETQRLVLDAYFKGEFNVNRLLKSQHNLASVASDYFEAAEKSWEAAAEIAGVLQLEQFP